MNNQIDYIEFKAQDLKKIKEFYSACFDWSFTDYGPDYTSFTDGRLNGGFEKTKKSIFQSSSTNCAQLGRLVVSVLTEISQPSNSGPFNDKQQVLVFKNGSLWLLICALTLQKDVEYFSTKFLG